jgi:hypothetical protein
LPKGYLAEKPPLITFETQPGADLVYERIAGRYEIYSCSGSVLLGQRPKDALHNPLRPAVKRPRAICCVVFLANSRTIDFKKDALQLIPIRLPQIRQGFAEHP